MMRRQRAIAVLNLLLFLAPIQAEEGHGGWAQFRGFNASGVNDASPLPDHLSQEALRWRVEIPHGVSSPCVRDDRVFITGVAESRLLTICLDANTGKEQWRRAAPEVPINATHMAGSPAAPTVTTDGDRVYVYFGVSGLLCYQWDGELVWHHKLPAPINRHGASSSPILVGGLLITCCDQGEVFQPQGSYLLAVNKLTGEEVWRTKRPLCSVGWTTPVVADEEVIVLGRRLIAYDVASGAEKWWLDGFMEFGITTPAIANGAVYAVTAAGGFEPGTRIQLPGYAELLGRHDANRDGRLVKDELPAEMVVYKGDTTGLPGDGVTGREAFDMFDGNKDQFLDAAEWDGALATWKSMQNVLKAIRLRGTGDVSRSHVLWRQTKQLPEVPSPLVYRDRLYLVKNGGIVSCLDAATGELRYRQRAGIRGNLFASPVAGDGKIFVVSDRGDIAVLAAGDEFRVISRARLNEQTIATPALANGNLYIRTSEHLYCYTRL